MPAAWRQRRQSAQIPAGARTSAEARRQVGCSGGRDASQTAARSGAFPEADGVDIAAPPPPAVALAYDLLAAAAGEVVVAIETRALPLASECLELQARTVDAARASALIAVQFVQALAAAERLGDVAAAQAVYSRLQREALNGEILEFLAAAGKLIEVLTSGPKAPCEASVRASAPPSPPDAAGRMAERLRLLTDQQKRVLALVTEGLPNKIIAYRLGLCETTVKAHVSAILRKLGVYSRARAIVLLANVDLGTDDGALDKAGSATTAPCQSMQTHPTHPSGTPAVTARARRS